MGQNKLSKLEKILLLSAVFLMSIALVFHLDSSLARAQVGVQDVAQNRITKEELDKHLKNLQKLYTDQIEAYRIAERQYKIDLAQYQQLETLSSQEKAVSAATQINKARTDVLISYFELLHARMVATRGMSLADKEELSPQIIKIIKQLHVHRGKIDNLTTKEEVNQLADEFEPLYENLTILSMRVQFLLDVAQLSAAQEDAEGLFARLKTRQEELPLSKIQRAERSRAYQQINDLFTEIKNEVTTQNALAVPVNNDFDHQQRELSKILSDLELKVLKVLGYLQELANVL